MGKHSHEFATHLSTPQSALEFAKALRNLANSAQSKFFEFLSEIESRPSLWNMCAPTFEQYIRDNHLADIALYARWKIGREVMHDDVQRTIGFHGVATIAKVPDERKETCVREMLETVAREGGVVLSQRRVNDIVSGHIEKPEPAPKRLTYEQLEKECDRLRRKVERLEATVAKLKAKKPRERRGGAEASPN